MNTNLQNVDWKDICNEKNMNYYFSGSGTCLIGEMQFTNCMIDGANVIATGLDGATIRGIWNPNGRITWIS